MPVTDPAARVVIDLSTYAAAAARLKTSPSAPDGDNPKENTP
jgi:hypothetical protein